MNIRNAFFGRKDSSICQYGNFTYTNCSTDAMELIKFYCQNKQLCFINAQAGQYGDPCPSVTKYLEFEYECVPKGNVAGFFFQFFWSVNFAKMSGFRELQGVAPFFPGLMTRDFQLNLIIFPQDITCKLIVHKRFRRRPGSLMCVHFTFCIQGILMCETAQNAFGKQI